MEKNFIGISIFTGLAVNTTKPPVTEKQPLWPTGELLKQDNKEDTQQILMDCTALQAV